MIQNPILGYAVLIDFALVIPFMYWFFITRRQGKPVWKVVPFTAAGALAAWFIFPPGMRDMAWKVILPAEILVFAFEAVFIVNEIRVLYRFIRRFRLVKRTEPETGEALRSAMKAEFGSSKLSSFLLHDMTMLYDLLFSWKKKRPAASPESGISLYSYHRKTSQILYAGIITHILVFEAVVVHLLLSEVASWAAWIATAGDLWILVWIWADCRGSVLRPVKLSEGKLTIRYGLRIQADVPIQAIASVTAAREFELDPAERKRTAGPLIGIPNVRIEFNRLVIVEGFLFLPREVHGLYLALDDPLRFAQDLQQARL